MSTGIRDPSSGQDGIGRVCVITAPESAVAPGQLRHRRDGSMATQLAATNRVNEGTPRKPRVALRTCSSEHLTRGRTKEIEDWSLRAEVRGQFLSWPRTPAHRQ